VNARDAHRRRRGICKDCGIDTLGKNNGDYYMVTDNLWERFGAGKSCLCLSCFETRLGRRVVKSDLLDCPVSIAWLLLYACPNCSCRALGVSGDERFCKSCGHRWSIPTEDEIDALVQKIVLSLAQQRRQGIAEPTEAKP